MTPAADGSNAQLGRPRRRSGTRDAACARRGGSPGPPGTAPAPTGARHQALPSALLTEADAAATASVTAAPALVIPLANRNTQIHPPGNTWCSAAASTGNGGCSSNPAAGVSPEPPTPREMRVEGLRRRQPRQRLLGEAERAVQKAARAARIDDEARADTQRPSAPVALQFHAVRRSESP